jgi:hypothetical protein
MHVTSAHHPTSTLIFAGGPTARLTSLYTISRYTTERHTTNWTRQAIRRCRYRPLCARFRWKKLAAGLHPETHPTTTMTTLLNSILRRSQPHCRTNQIMPTPKRFTCRTWYSSAVTGIFPSELGDGVAMSYPPIGVIPGVTPNGVAPPWTMGVAPNEPPAPAGVSSHLERPFFPAGVAPIPGVSPGAHPGVAPPSICKSHTRIYISTMISYLEYEFCRSPSVSPPPPPKLSKPAGNFTFHGLSLQE